jgi:hypothetical protein
MKTYIGWTDEANPNGIGYQIMTEEGLKTFDDKKEFESEVERVKNFLKSVPRRFA